MGQKLSKKDKLELIADKLLNEVFSKDELRFGDKDGWCVKIHEIAKHWQIIEVDNQLDTEALKDAKKALELGLQDIDIIEKHLSQEVKLTTDLHAENAKLKEALFKFIPVTFHGEKKAFEDSDFTDAFKNMVIQAYLMDSGK